jgi:hypothetical protein
MVSMPWFTNRVQLFVQLSDISEHRRFCHPAGSGVIALVLLDFPELAPLASFCYTLSENIRQQLHP